MQSTYYKAVLICILVSPSYARPVLWYAFEKGGTQNDIGTAPQANGALTGSAAAIGNGPSSYSCASLDLTPNAAVSNYVGTGTDVQKIDALSEMTVTLWFNLQSAPLNNDCLVSDCPSGFPPAGQGGWELYIVNPLGGGAISAANFSLSFRNMRANGGFNNTQGTTSPVINASNKWVFVSVTFNASRLQKYYLGSDTTAVAQIGSNSIYSEPLLDNSADFRVGSSTANPAVDRTPPAWVDDVRVYNTALTLAQLEAIRLENLQFSFPPAPSFFVLQDLPGGGCFSGATAVSSNGNVIVGQSFSTVGFEAYRWINGVLTLVGDLPGGSVSAYPTDVSLDGSVVVGVSASTNAANEAFRWVSGTLFPMGDFPGGEFFSTAYGVSNDGSKIVGFGVDRAGFLGDAFLWEGGPYQKLGYLDGGDQSAAYDISSDGAVIIGINISAGGLEGFRHENGKMIALGDLPGGTLDGRPAKISASKHVIVGQGRSASGLEAALWCAGTVVGLGDLPGGTFNSGAKGTTGFGSIIVGTGRNASNQDEAFIWGRYNGLRRFHDVLQNDYGLDLTWWRLSTAYGISDDGSTIVGIGLNPSGVNTSWVAKLPPLPAVADLDKDGDVDDLDFDIFNACITRAAVPYNPVSLPPGCTVLPDLQSIIPPDFDWDHDVDMTDFAVFQRCLSGSGQPPPVECRG